MKMTLLGAGVRAPFVLRGLTAGQEDLGLDEVVLHDTDPERLELMAALGAHLCAEWGAGFTVRGEPDAGAALAASSRRSGRGWRARAPSTRRCR